ncbi:MAG: folylpolyglutamate synthase/dihydrofolate synthase family protein [Verrucomicrobiota bacterium]
MSGSQPTEAKADSVRIRDYLYSLRNTGSKYGIERMYRFAAALGNPQRAFPSIHVAGTNGKGSVCAILEALYRSNGYKTGLYTSPHLVHLGERVQVNREILSEAAINQTIPQLIATAEALSQEDPDDHPSFFELMTATAFLEFAAQNVDIALIETGLGGRLDATNILQPELSIITSISLDHTEILGNDLDTIAFEKAGIIKANTPVLLGKLAPEAEAVIRKVAAERNAPVHSVKERFSDFDALPKTNLEGSFQRWNAGLAVYASELLAPRFPLKSTEALQDIDWAGRWQRLQLNDRQLILDATHNPEGVEMLAENLENLAQASDQKPIVIAGTLGADRGRALMPVLAQYAREIHLLAPAQERALSTEALARLIPNDFQGPIIEDRIDRLFPSPNQCAAGQAGDTILVTGSLYLIGEVLQQLQGANKNNLQDKP